MSKVKFADKVHREMRIDVEKVDPKWLKAKMKYEKNNYDARNSHDAIPNEFHIMKNFMQGKPKQNLKKNHVFDVNNDGKSIKKKKVSKADKLKRPYMMYDSKKFHSF